MKSTTLTWPSSLPHLLLFRRQCPLCTGTEFQEAEAHPLDGMLGLFGLHPVRCSNCWRRYYWFARKTS